MVNGEEEEVTLVVELVEARAEDGPPLEIEGRAGELERAAPRLFRASGAGGRTIETGSPPSTEKTVRSTSCRRTISRRLASSAGTSRRPVSLRRMGTL
jgi:hypothetical protein